MAYELGDLMMSLEELKEAYKTVWKVMYRVRRAGGAGYHDSAISARGGD